VPAVVFSPDRAGRRSRRRTGLVLGAGGLLGAAWMTGALACLQDRLPCAAGDVDVIVGTSAGAVLAAALRCHAPVEEMMAWQCGEATVASCSIPGWYEPTVIGGRRYVDGGMRSATSLDVLRGTDVRDVYVLAPTASTEPGHPLLPYLWWERRLRQVITYGLLRQARALCAQGKRVTVLTPGPKDLAAMGINLMDRRRSEGVLDLSLRTSADALRKAKPGP
jgi:predicted acylesterase/phospholipase RssA